MLARLSRNSFCLNGAQHALAFVQAMFDATSGHFWTGSSDPTHIFYNNSPKDCQSGLTSLPGPELCRSDGLGEDEPSTTDITFAFNNGWAGTVAYACEFGTVLGDNTVDGDAVWIEGTGHLMAALYFSGLRPGQDIPSFHRDRNLANTLIENMLAQNSLGAGQTVNAQL